MLCVAKAKQFQMKALPQRDRALPLPPGNLSTLHLSVMSNSLMSRATLSYLSFCGQECGRHMEALTKVTKASVWMCMGKSLWQWYQWCHKRTEFKIVVSAGCQISKGPVLPLFSSTVLNDAACDNGELVSWLRSQVKGQCGVAGPLPRETPACLSYSPATGVTESSFNAFNTTPSVAANIRPPPGLEHMSVMDSGSRHPSPLDFLDPLVLPMPGPLGTEPPSFRPPKFAAPHVDLEDTPPAPPKEPCLRLALLQYLPTENEKIVDDQNKSHDTSSCRPCAFYHTKGCALGCKGRRDEKSDLKDFHVCLICAFACISATSVNIPVGNAGQNGSQCIFCHICPPGEKKRRQKLRRKAGGSVGCLAAPGCTLPSLAWYAWHRLPRKIPNGAKSIPFLRTGSGLKVALSSIFQC